LTTQGEKYDMYQPTNSLSFYFSFRSPYAWLAFHRLSKIAEQLPVNIKYIPLIPPRQFSGTATDNPQKTSYMAEDIGRFAKAYGLYLQWPTPFDTDWNRPHASFLYALDQGRAVEFGLAAFAARFSQGKDLGGNNTLAAIAVQCGLQPEAVIQNADNDSLQRRILKGSIRGQREGLTGVPFFVYQGRRYWGNDRLEWVVRDISDTIGLDTPDLSEHVFSCPFDYQKLK
jgi:2-hydroxychromene-2-carboxylate isomerase